MEIREASPKDAERFISLIQKVEAEAEFMLMEPGERKMTIEQQRKFLQQMNKTNNSIILVADKESELVGYVIAIGGNTKRNKHSAYLVIGVIKEYRGHGIGTKLFQQLEKWAITNQMYRLELTVVTENERGLSLYMKRGFEIEGTKRNSLMINGTLYSEYIMSKVFIKL
ncbi:GNAT family N-acetyltransferase [Halalkalibacter alkalisediminis]|uniref:GNAT family N-acetyltransferase n=1 Tax=Halalkalibacter alkalisediminis TaxID=935616 RepID=A0ABV6NH93_9BACI|nr:GNAT family N-acetyltransferase [Halalkalibacter alkalisediminis]